MSKIFKALEQAQKEKLRQAKRDEALSQLETPVASVEIEEEMLTLYKNVEIALSHASNKVLQFIGIAPGVGTSTICREFSKVAALKIEKDVLLLDADRMRPVQQNFFDIDVKCSWIDAIRPGRRTDQWLCQAGRSKLFVSPSKNSRQSTPEIFDSSLLDQFLEGLKKQFNLIVIDSAPLSISRDGLGIANKADGIIFVVQAEKSRWPEMNKMKETIHRSGGNIVGIVFNKRRYRIPRFIYRFI
jgi:Mrp family chromosome partitioning ATPase